MTHAHHFVHYKRIDAEPFFDSKTATPPSVGIQGKGSIVTHDTRLSLGRQHVGHHGVTTKVEAQARRVLVRDVVDYIAIEKRLRSKWESQNKRGAHASQIHRKTK